MLSKKILLPIFGLMLTAGVTLGVTQANAQTKPNPLSGLVQMIAQKFGLDQNQLQAVVDQYQNQKKQQRQQTMQQRLKSRLDQAVSQGKLTSQKEQALLDKLASLRSNFNPSSLKSMTPAQRKQFFQNQQSELKSWAQSQGIDLSQLNLKIGWGMKKGRV